MLKYIYPNFWLLSNDDKLKICVYNEHQTELYLVNYSKFMTSKIIKPLANLIFSIINKIILKEYKRIIKTQKYDDNYNTIILKIFLLRHDQIIKEFRKIWND